MIANTLLLEPRVTTAPNTPCLLVPRLCGGIGNQLFQVVSAYRLARLSGLHVAFDTSGCGPDQSAGASPVLQRLWPEAALFDGTFPPETTRSLCDSELTYPTNGPLPALPKLPVEVSHLVLDGDWQDYRLAEPASVADVRRRLERAVPAKVLALGQLIAGDPHTVAVHIRRRDYKHQGLAADGYYIDTLRWLAGRGATTVLVFSDEPQYSAYFLQRAGIRARLVATGDEFSDLYLMAQCHHHVMANSTVSWWAAMLSGADEVIWPAPWSKEDDSGLQLCPPHWLRIADAVEHPSQSSSSSTATFGAALEADQFRRDQIAFFSQAPLPAGWGVQLRHCPGEATTGTQFDAHYVYHTAWAARRLVERPVAQHVDISSDLRFVTIASAFQPMRFLDWRPAAIKLSGLECGRADLLSLDHPDQSMLSVSCMHVAEHIGLGRYGDSLNFHGASIAMRELQRVLAPGGYLYFVVPVGQPTIVFHAHRIFRASDIVTAFGELELVEFSLVKDDGSFVEHVSPAVADSQRYGCGCFLFRRPVYAIGQA